MVRNSDAVTIGCADCTIMSPSLSAYSNLPSVTGSTRTELLVVSVRHTTRPSPSGSTALVVRERRAAHEADDVAHAFQKVPRLGALRELAQHRPAVRFRGHVRLRLDLPVRARGAALPEGNADEGGVAVEQVVERAVADVPHPGAVPKVRTIL
jgi:hypothetical protein